VRRADNLATFMWPIVLKSGSLNLLEPSGPVKGLLYLYYGITKMYDRKTVGHVFTKPVQIEGTTQIFPPESCFSSLFTFLPLGVVYASRNQVVAH
jgi:hypothetical protein